MMIAVYSLIVIFHAAKAFLSFFEREKWQFVGNILVVVGYLMKAYYI